MAPRYKNTSIESKNSILLSTLSEVFGDKMNLARIKFFGLFIMALCKVQTVCFEKFAASFENEVQSDSSLRRIQCYIGLFGKDSIDCLLADREFIGDHWLGYLNANRIRYHIRIRDNFWVFMPRNGHRVKASWLFNHLKINRYAFYSGIIYVKGQLCYLSASKVKNKQGAPEFQIIVSFNKPEQAQSVYKERWQIETALRL